MKCKGGKSVLSRKLNWELLMILLRSFTFDDPIFWLQTGFTFCQKESNESTSIWKSLQRIYFFSGVLINFQIAMLCRIVTQKDAQGSFRMNETRHVLKDVLGKKNNQGTENKELFFSSQKYIVFDILQSRIIPCCYQITRKDFFC